MAFISKKYLKHDAQIIRGVYGRVLAQHFSTKCLSNLYLPWNVGCILKDCVPYYDIGAAEYNKRFRKRELKYFHKKAVKLGYTPSPAS
jgi:hypothetical protein